MYPRLAGLTGVACFRLHNIMQIFVLAIFCKLEVEKLISRVNFQNVQFRTKPFRILMSPHKKLFFSLNIKKTQIDCYKLVPATIVILPESFPRAPKQAQRDNRFY